MRRVLLAGLRRTAPWTLGEGSSCKRCRGLRYASPALQAFLPQQRALLYVNHAPREALLLRDRQIALSARLDRPQNQARCHARRVLQERTHQLLERSIAAAAMPWGWALRPTKVARRAICVLQGIFKIHFLVNVQSVQSIQTAR